MLFDCLSGFMFKRFGVFFRTIDGYGKDKAFESFVFDPNDEQIRELLRGGYDGLDFMKS